MMLLRQEQQLEALGERLGSALRRGTGSRIVALVGELGVGKTTLTRGIAKGLGVREQITSPTFVIVKRYDTEDTGALWHIDAYRLIGAADVESVDFAGMQEREGVMVIEWADQIRDAIPQDALWVTLSHDPEGRRVEGLEHLSENI